MAEKGDLKRQTRECKSRVISSPHRPSGGFVAKTDGSELPGGCQVRRSRPWPPRQATASPCPTWCLPEEWWKGGSWGVYPHFPHNPSQRPVGTTDELSSRVRCSPFHISTEGFPTSAARPLDPRACGGMPPLRAADPPSPHPPPGGPPRPLGDLGARQGSPLGGYRPVVEWSNAARHGFPPWPGGRVYLGGHPTEGKEMAYRRAGELSTGKRGPLRARGEVPRRSSTA